MSDKIFLPWDGTREAFAAIQALVPGAWRLEDEAVCDRPLIVFPGESGATVFPGDTVTYDRGTGVVGVIERDEISTTGDRR